MKIFIVFHSVIHFLEAIISILSTVQGSPLNCVHNLNETSNVITTPNYPNTYPPNISCRWTITVPDGYYVQLTFEEFDVESWVDCKTDFLEIKDGGSISAPLFGGQYCNRRRPTTIVTSSKNQLRLWFKTDSTIHHRGFRATYKAVEDEACGREFQTSFGELTTPRFPLHYPNSRQCNWKIIAPKGKRISVYFLYFEIETICPAHEACRCVDEVKIKDGDSEKTYCFDFPPAMVTTGNTLSISFASDTFGRMRGFKALFSFSSTQACGGEYFAGDGTIEYPIFGWKNQEYYSQWVNCVWKISSKPDEFVSIKIVKMDIVESNQGTCSDDYLEIRDGPNQYSKLIGYFCNTHKKDSLVSTGSFIFIRFISDGKKSGKGFRLSFISHRKSCLEPLGIEDGRITRFQLYASSSLKMSGSDKSFVAQNGRLNSNSSWCSQERTGNFRGEYIEIDFFQETKITKVATQGYLLNGKEHYVTKYNLFHVNNETFMDWHGNKKKDKTIYSGNTDFNTIKINELTPPIIATKLRFVPTEIKSNRESFVCCMRIEVYGCNVKRKYSK